MNVIGVLIGVVVIVYLVNKIYPVSYTHLTLPTKA